MEKIETTSPVAFTFTATTTDDRTLAVTLHADGRVELPDGASVDEAARIFWAAVAGDTNIVANAIEIERARCAALAIVGGHGCCGESIAASILGHRQLAS